MNMNAPFPPHSFPAPIVEMARRNFPIVMDSSEVRDGYIRNSSDNHKFAYERIPKLPVKLPYGKGLIIYARVYKRIDGATISYSPTQDVVVIKKLRKAFLRREARDAEIISSETPLNEIAASQLLGNNIHVVSIQEALEDAKYFYLVMPCHGRDLLDVLQDGGDSGVQPNVPVLLRALVSNLLYLEENHVLHRGLSPENIKVLGEHYEICCPLTDLNMALRCPTIGGNIHPIKSQEPCGKLTYMSPEVAHSSPLSFGINVWAIGLTLFFIWTNQQLYDQPNDRCWKYFLQNGGIEQDQFGLFEDWMALGEVPQEYLPIVQKNAAIQSLTASQRHLLAEMLRLEPTGRIKARDILNHKWLNEFKQQEQLQRVPSVCKHCYKCEWDEVQEYLSSSKDPNHVKKIKIYNQENESEHAYNTLHWACGWNAPVDVVKSLIDIGGGKELVMKTDYFGVTALHLACWGGARYDVIKMLVDIGGKELVMTKDNKGRTALHEIAKHLFRHKDGALDKVKLLLKNGDSRELLTAKDKDGFTFLSYWIKPIAIHPIAIREVRESGNTISEYSKEPGSLTRFDTAPDEEKSTGVDEMRDIARKFDKGVDIRYLTESKCIDLAEVKSKDAKTGHATPKMSALSNWLPGTNSPQSDEAQGAYVVSMESSLSHPEHGNETKINIQMIHVVKGGNLFIGKNELMHYKAGDLKFNVDVSGWEWSDNGKYLELVTSIVTDGINGYSSWVLDNDRRKYRNLEGDLELSLSNQFFIDGEWKTEDFPKFDEGKQLFTIRFPRFEHIAFYDPRVSAIVTGMAVVASSANSLRPHIHTVQQARPCTKSTTTTSLQYLPDHHQFEMLLPPEQLLSYCSNALSIVTGTIAISEKFGKVQKDSNTRLGNGMNRKREQYLKEIYEWLYEEAFKGIEVSEDHIEKYARNLYDNGYYPPSRLVEMANDVNIQNWKWMAAGHRSDFERFLKFTKSPADTSTVNLHSYDSASK